MGDWRAIAEQGIQNLIEAAVAQMTKEQRCLFNLIRVDPMKWSLEKWGDAGGGFWVVAVLGNEVIWYNDIEEGFNCSTYSIYGTIDDYRCNQDELESVIARLIYELKIH